MIGLCRAGKIFDTMVTLITRSSDLGKQRWEGGESDRQYIVYMSLRLGWTREGLENMIIKFVVFHYEKKTKLQTVVRSELSPSNNSWMLDTTI